MSQSGAADATGLFLPLTSSQTLILFSPFVCCRLYESQVCLVMQLTVHSLAVETLNVSIISAEFIKLFILLKQLRLVKL